MPRDVLLLASIVSALALAACGDDETAATAGPGGSSAQSTSSAGGAGGLPQGGSGGTGGSATSSSSAGGGTMTSTCNGATCDIAFSGSGFEMYEGKTIHWGLLEQGQMGLVFQTSGTITNGSFSFDEMGVTSKGTSYFLNYYIDQDDNGMCIATGNDADPKWRIQLTGVQTHYDIHVVYDVNNQANLGCAGFN